MSRSNYGQDILIFKEDTKKGALMLSQKKRKEMSIVSLPCLIVKHNLGLKTIHQLFQSQKIPQATKQHSGKTKICVNCQFQYFSCSENIPKFEIWCRFLDCVEPEENRNNDIGNDTDTESLIQTQTVIQIQSVIQTQTSIKTCKKLSTFVT